MLALDKVSKFYGRRTIFENVSWAMTDDALREIGGERLPTATCNATADLT